MTVIYKETHWKWVKYNTPKKKYRPRGTGMQMWSKRFGYLDSYTTAERRLLVCPSGYTFPQGMNKLNKVWWGYLRSRKENNIERMEHYARQIQDVQEDLGLKTTSFPHLGIYGDQLTLYDHSTSRKDSLPKVSFYTDHSELKQLQELEKQKEVLDKKLQDITPLIEADESKGEELITIIDKIPQPEYRYRVKNGNRMHYGKKTSEEWVCENCNETVPANKNHICKHNEEEENLLIIPDDLPFESSQEN
jgi:hypothetical protein